MRPSKLGLADGPVRHTTTVISLALFLKQSKVTMVKKSQTRGIYMPQFAQQKLYLYYTLKVKKQEHLDEKQP